MDVYCEVTVLGFGMAVVRVGLGGQLVWYGCCSVKTLLLDVDCSVRLRLRLVG